MLTPTTSSLRVTALYKELKTKNGQGFSDYLSAAQARWMRLQASLSKDVSVA